MKNDREVIISILNSLNYIQEVPINKQEIDSIYQELDPYEVFIQREKFEELHEFINSLSKIEQQYIYLRYGFLDRIYSNKEISEKLKIKLTQVKSLNMIVINKLRLYYLGFKVKRKEFKWT